MKRNHYVFFFLFVVCVLGSLTGCGEKEVEDFDELSSMNSNEVYRRLTIYLRGENRTGSERIINAVEQESNLGIDLNIRVMSDETYINEVAKALHSGNDMDMYINYEPIGSAEQFGKSNLVKDLSEDLPQYAPFINQRIENEYPLLMNKKSEIYMIPPFTVDQYVPTVYIDKEIADAYEIGEIKDLSTYTEILTKLSNEDFKIPVSQLRIYYCGIYTFANLFGYMVMDNDLGLVYKADDPSMSIVAWENTLAFEEMVKLLNKWESKGAIYHTDEGYKESITYFELSGELVDGIKERRFADRTKEYYSYVLSNEYPLQRNSSFNQYYGGFVFRKRSENIDRGLMFLEWIYKNQDNYDLFMYGIKGEDYILDDGQISYLKDSGQYDLSNYGGWYMKPFWDYNYFRFSNQQDGNKEQLDAFKRFTLEEMVYPPHEGFVKTNRLEVSTSVNTRLRALYNYIYWPIKAGVFDLSDIEKVREVTDKAGTDIIVKTMQEEFDDWRAQ